MASIKICSSLVGTYDDCGHGIVLDAGLGTNRTNPQQHTVGICIFCGTGHHVLADATGKH